MNMIDELQLMMIFIKYTSKFSTGNPLIKRSPPQEVDVQPAGSWGLFSLCIVIKEKRTKLMKIVLIKRHCIDVYVMNLHMSTLHHAPIYRNFYLFKHFDVERPMKVCALTGLSRAPPPKLKHELCLQVSYWNQLLSGAFPLKHRPSTSCTDVQVNIKKYVTTNS